MVCVILLASTYIVSVSPAQTSPRQMPTESQVKAVYLYNFARFIEWPNDDYREGIHICLLGEDPFGDQLSTLGQQTAKGHPLVLVRLDSLDASDGCHILFIARSETSHLPSIFERLRASSILTVGESKGFTDIGGMVGFVDNQGRVALEINLEAARAASLQISSKLLEVAVIVRSSPIDGAHP